MQARFVAVLTLVAAHATAIIAAPHLPPRLAAVVAGSIYLPLLLFDALGLPVFGHAESGGWPSPSVLGWGVLCVLWLGLWWMVGHGIARFFRSRARSS